MSLVSRVRPILGVAALALGVAAGCRDQDREHPGRKASPPAAGGSAAEFDRHFERIGAVTLEENDDVINVAPIASIDTDGGLLVVDMKEAQGRRYSAEGKLLQSFGNRGRGPGEFRAPSAVRRLPSGDILVTDALEGRLTVLDSAAREVAFTRRVELFPLYDAVPLEGEKVLLVGQRPVAEDSPLLHVFDLRTGKVERSFFTYPVEERMRPVVKSMGWADASLRGETILAAFGTSDTVFTFDRAGTVTGRVQIPFSDYRPLTYPPEDVNTDPRERTRWMETLVRVTDVIPLDDGTLLVQTGGQRGAENVFGLLRMTRDGKRIFELRDSPRLMAARGDTLYFVEPGSETPNRWLLARVRPAA